MRINRLILHNFGIYANTNTLNLVSDKPVILIGGMNGRGKTTFLEAILLALYGRRSFAFVESKLSFPNYLTRLVNKSDGSYETYVEMIFELSSGDEVDSYTVRREWSLHNAIPAFKTLVYKNSAYDPILSDNWDLFIEEMLPSAIAPFFFFDGEKVSELANSDNETHMKNSIKSLLGIDIIDQAIADIHKIVNNKKRTIKVDAHIKEIAEYERVVKKAENEVKEAIAAAGQLKIAKDKVANNLQNAENDFAKMGGNLASERKKLLVQQSVISERLEEVNAQLLEVVSGDLPLLMTLQFLKQILSISESEREQKAIHAALEQLPALYQEFDKKEAHDIDFSKFLNFIKSSAKETNPIYDFTENGLFQLKTLCSTLPSRQRDNVIELQSKRQRLLAEQTETENYLSISVDESAAGNKQSEILQLTAELATLTEQHRIAQQYADSKQSTHEELIRQQLKVIERAVGSMEGSTDTKRIVTYAGYSIEVLKTYKVRLQKEKAQSLAKTMTYCFKSIASKQNLIGEIQIDPVTLDFIYLDSEGKLFNRSSFSAGERQLLVIAMLWALGICSKKRLPVIIDTPLARLDSTHREMLITNYFPKASEQTILLSTDSEVHGKYYDMIQPYVDKEYTLVYNDQTKQTVVQKGYFGGAVK